MTTRKRVIKAVSPALKVGDCVRLLRDTRHGMVKAGSVGTIVEIRIDGAYSGRLDGVTVEFMILPEPRIARMFGKDPLVPEPFRCLFPKGGRPPLELVK